MVTYFTQLHEDISDLVVNPGLKIIPGLSTGHEFVVQESLTFGKRAQDKVFVFTW